MGGDNSAVIHAGLPNITGQFGRLTNVGAAEFTGAFDVTSTRISHGGVNDAYNAGIGVFDASKANEIYGKSNSVQPPAFALIPQIRF